MKYFGWIIGVVLVAGAGFAGYYYGSGQFDREPTVIVDDEDTDIDKEEDQPSDEDSNPVYVGPTYVRIDSPANGAVITADSPFTVSGSVSPNAEKIRVQAYDPKHWDYIGSPVYEKKIDDYTLTQFKLGDTSWSYKVGHEFGNITPGRTMAARFVVQATFTDKTVKESQISVTYTYEMAEMGKPVIYLYPEKPTWVSVNVQPTDGISVSEPAIFDGWNVWANPNGQLINSDGTMWPYLFWEGFANNFVTPKEGFVISSQEVASFFDDKLVFLGLNKKEIADFKEFWVPRMQAKPYYFVSFIEQEVFDAYAPLTVSPMPDTVIRVFFDHQGLSQRINVPTQTLTPAPIRDGFTVIEWGGRLYR
jgi:hypothetical protein